jgi:mercuric ion transport protein
MPRLRRAPQAEGRGLLRVLLVRLGEVPADAGRAGLLRLAVDRRTRLLRVGIIGTVIAALCCFTPILVLLLGAVGLAALTGYLDYVLIPALVFFIGLTVYAVYRRKRETL